MPGFTKHNASEMGKLSGESRRDIKTTIQTHCQMMADRKKELILGRQNGFTPAKLTDIMDQRYIIRRQKYTPMTHRLYKNAKQNCRKTLTEKSVDIPKYFLQSTNQEYDCKSPLICDNLNQLLMRGWNLWKHDVSQDSFIIGLLDNSLQQNTLQKQHYYSNTQDAFNKLVKHKRVKIH